MPAGQNLNIVIKKNQGLYSVSNSIYPEHTAKHYIEKNLMLIFGKIWLFIHKKNIQCGEYEIKKNDTIYTIIKKIGLGTIKYYNIVFPEGLTTENILYEISQNNILIGNTPQKVSEGELFPSTYQIVRSEERAHLVERMKKEMNTVLQKEWGNRDPDLPFKTPYQALILASILEKEVGASYCPTDEYKNVASVFINRLKKPMRLESSPTVFYGLLIKNMKHGDVNTLARNPTLSELKVCHPYNTYCIKGLPPTPICNPSGRAIKAVLHPAKTDYLFFMSDGNNCHSFSNNFEDHKINRSKYNKTMKTKKTNLTK